MSSPFGSAEDELAMIKTILAKTLNADTFTEAIKALGFQFEEESPLTGLIMQTDYSRVLLKVKSRIHPTNIAALMHLDKATEKVTCLVEDGETT